MRDPVTILGTGILAGAAHTQRSRYYDDGLAGYGDSRAWPDTFVTDDAAEGSLAGSTHAALEFASC